MRRAALPWLALAAAACAACDPPGARGGAADAGDDARSTARGARDEPLDTLGPGCRRTGAISAIELDESCVVPGAEPRETLAALRQLMTTLTTDAPETLGGGQLNVRLAITNTGKQPVALVLEAEPPGAGAHYDWSLLSGLSPPRAPQNEGFKMRFVMRTLDAREQSTDQLRIVAPAAPPPVKLYRIILAPQATLTHSFQWLALRIPAPYPPFDDDAGHRVVPKTAPRPLAAGKYTVSVDVPFYGVAVQQRTVSTPVLVL